MGKSYHTGPRWRPLTPRSVLLLAGLVMAGGAWPLPAQPLLAVMPLQPLGEVSREEADTVGRLLETALVNSTAFQVVEKSDIAEVLAVQEYAAEEFVEENFAVRVGKLLSAERILLGTLSRLNGRYYLTAKIIEVATGRTLRADKEEADTIAAMAARAVALGKRLGTERLQATGKPFVRSDQPQGQTRALPPQAASGCRALVEERSALLAQRRTLERKLESENLRSGRLKTAALVCYGVGAGFALGSGVTLAVSFGGAAVPSTVPWKELSASFAIVGGLWAIAGTAIHFERPDLAAIRTRISEIEKQARLLESRIQEEDLKK